MGLIPEETIAQVIERCDIAQVIASYLPLKRAGRNFKACCPFHHEKTPSFVVNPDKQIFHCFGCGEGGNVIKFVMLQERVEFPEAVKMLAAPLGIVITQNETLDPQALSLKELLYKINDLAANFFHSTLATSNTESENARQYLKKRDVAFETAKKLKLGFVSDKWDSLLNHLRAKNISLSVMEKAGLIIPNDGRDGFHDRFRDRIIFPIFDIRGNCIAFGGRAMKDGVAKYMNSPETAVYTKGNHLYGFNLAKDGVREKDFVIVVEGYMDFLIPFQAGVNNIVASLGTALTVDQIRLIRRYTHNIVMLFDADQAGESAMIRSLDLLIDEGMSVKVAVLTSGDDPDSFVCKFGVERFNEQITAALSLFDYKLKILMGQHSHKTVEGKARISSEMLPTINRFDNAVMKFGYIKRLSEVLAVPEQALLMDLQKVPSPTTGRQEPSLKFSTTTAPVQTRNVEHSLLKLMLDDGDDQKNLFLIKQELTVLDFQDERIRSVVQQIFQLTDEGKKISTAALMGCFDDKQILQIISQLMTREDIVAEDREKMTWDCINRVKNERLKNMRRDLSHQIKLAETSGDHGRLSELTQRFNQLLKG
ncbi:MAG TPA: DNA primase [Candidatus Omnitrophota bacterium]|nr:DNA primase [Candidatus Omnitrophota bacterium]HPD84046.1 DNA primase [Candidatus Omnitrophota bacterium]HRZ02903.1 DNA primase [Candidatus Omnitrophota bacterium]